MGKYTSMGKVNEVIRQMLRQGWTIERTKKHLVLRSPDGYSATVGKTIRDAGHGAANSLSQIRRYWREYEQRVAREGGLEGESGTAQRSL